MQPPETPADEAERLATLFALGALDRPPDERFEAVVRIAQRLFDVPIALVSLVDTDRQWFRARVGLDVCETSREVSFCGHAILHDEPLVVPDARRDPRFHDNPIVTGPPHVISYAGVPLRLDATGSGIGTLCIIDHVPRDFRSQLPLLRDLAGMVLAHFGVDRRANTDPLTGLSNRRGLAAAGPPLVALCDRLGAPVAVVYIDLDRFKQINDEHGHAAGDAALVEMGGLLQATFRGSDVVVRIGGDEFAVLCPELGADGVDSVRGRLRAATEGANRTRPGSWQLDYSFGSVVREPGSAEGWEALLERADLAMFEEKRRRRQAVAAFS